MTYDLDKRVALFRAAISAALMEWDPLGIRGIVELQDEYDAYVQPIHQLLASHLPEIRQAIFNYLWSVETKTLNLDGDRHAIDRCAARLMQVIDEVDNAIVPRPDPRQLRLEGVEEAGGLPSSIDAGDDYIPLQFRTFPDPPGLGRKRYLLLGRRGPAEETGPGTSVIRDWQHLELKVSHASMTLRAFTLVGSNTISQRRLVGPADSIAGLPILRLPVGSSFDGPYAQTDLDFAVFIEEAAVELQIGKLLSYDTAYRHGRVDFLISEGTLAGIRIQGLSKAETEHIASHEARQTGRPAGRV